jgi:hypothetical protein
MTLDRTAQVHAAKRIYGASAVTERAGNLYVSKLQPDLTRGPPVLLGRLGSPKLQRILFTPEGTVRDVPAEPEPSKSEWNEAIEAAAKACEPSNVDDPSDWTDVAKVRAECAATVRALKR